jgi:hypothetical protein
MPTGARRAKLQLPRSALTLLILVSAMAEGWAQGPEYDVVGPPGAPEGRGRLGA